MPTTNSADGSVVICHGEQPSGPQSQMLQKVAALIGGQLVVDQVGHERDPSWVKFHFIGIPDALVMMKLETNENQLLAGNDAYDWQILKSSSPQDGPGMWLHHLCGISQKGECKAGVGYY